MEQITSSSLVVHLKLKCLLKKPTQDDNMYGKIHQNEKGWIEAKEFYIQLFFERYKKK